MLFSVVDDGLVGACSVLLVGPFGELNSLNSVVELKAVLGSVDEAVIEL